VTVANELLGDWLDRELAGVPQELGMRVRTALPAAWQSASLMDGAAILTAAAAGELRTLLERGCETRWAAPGLLTVDALVTYACELLALAGSNIDAGTADILNTIVQTLPQQGSVA